MAIEIKVPEKDFSAAEVVTPFSPRTITHVFHDIDGTHSLIREWVPVMTLTTGAVAKYGMFPGSPHEIAGAIIKHREERFEEAYRFSIESAGLSALTQMEWALRMAERLTGNSTPANEAIISEIWQGRELFDEKCEDEAFRKRMKEGASLLFKAYEILLLEMGRDANLAAARKNPESWRVPGSMTFLQQLHQAGVKNYFVTGAVVEHDEKGIPRGTMYEEIQALQFPIGKGDLIEALCGSSWYEKQPKVEIMKEICRTSRIDPRHVLIVGDGRSEIAAGVELGALTLSRLDSSAHRPRAIHRALGTNLIVENYEGLFEALCRIID